MQWWVIQRLLDSVAHVVLDRRSSCTAPLYSCLVDAAAASLRCSAGSRASRLSRAYAAAALDTGNGNYPFVSLKCAARVLTIAAVDM